MGVGVGVEVGVGGRGGGRSRSRRRSGSFGGGGAFSLLLLRGSRFGVNVSWWEWQLQMWWSWKSTKKIFLSLASMLHFQHLVATLWRDGVWFTTSTPEMRSQITCDSVARNSLGSGGGGVGHGGEGFANHSGIREVLLLGGVLFLGGDDGLLFGGDGFGFGLVLLRRDGAFGESRNLTQKRFSSHLRACPLSSCCCYCFGCERKLLNTPSCVASLLFQTNSFCAEDPTPTRGDCIRDSFQIWDEKYFITYQKSTQIKFYKPHKANFSENMVTTKKTNQPKTLNTKI